MKRGAVGRQRGHGWFEFALVAIVLSVLAALLIDRLLAYQAAAEKTAVDITVRQLQTALRWQAAQILLHRRPQDLARLAGANPVAWLERPPPDYLGEQAAPGAAAPVGSWHFDPVSRELVYVPRHAFAPAAVRAPRLAWRVQPLKSPSGADVIGPVSGLVLAQTAPGGPAAKDPGQ